jgi:acid phosphatase
VTSTAGRTGLALLLAGVLAAALGACSTERPGASASTAGDTTVRKVLVVVVENHSLDQMRAEMPYTFSLALRHGYASSYTALTHPSLGNYLAIAGGSTFGVEDDGGPSHHPLHGPSVFSQALGAGHTAALYAEAMPAPCALSNSGTYAVRHNPWAYFVDDRDACSQADLPLTRLTEAIEAGSLPDVGLVIPDLCNDAHDCSLATADSWLHALTQQVMAGPDWRSGHLAVVVTADEDDHDQGNRVLTALLHPSLHQVVVDAPLTHLALSRFLSEVVGEEPLREASDAPSLGDAFGLRTDA